MLIPNPAFGRFLQNEVRPSRDRSEPQCAHLVLFCRAGAILDAVELMSPPWERESTGFWIDLSTEILDTLASAGIDGSSAIHAAEHAFLNQFALAQDVKTDCRVAKEDYSEARTSAPVIRPPRYVPTWRAEAD